MTSTHVAAVAQNVNPTDFYQVVGANNRNVLIQSKRIAPYHEDNTKVQIFEPSSVSPGQYTKIKLDFKHALDREIILNDIRLQFQVDLSATSNVGRVYAIRGTDLIREMVVKINEDIVFKVDKKGELSMLWEMNNHRTVGSAERVHNSTLMNYGVIPKGRGIVARYDSTRKNWYTGAGTANYNSYTDAQLHTFLTCPDEERWDGMPRLIYNDATGGSTYIFKFDISLNQLVGPIFTKLHIRRIEFVQIELMFEPFITQAETQNFLLFASDPTTLTRDGTTGAPLTTRTHPYALAKYTNIQIQQWRTTLLDGVNGFTMPDNRMLSWLMHRYSRREYTFNFDTQTSIDIQLNDWEIRTNIVRLWWMLAPQDGSNTDNLFRPFGDPTEPMDYLSGVEILWKNDKVLDLASSYDVYRHYILSENKRFGFDDPFIRFNRLDVPTGYLTDKATRFTKRDGKIVYYNWLTTDATPTFYEVGEYRYEFPIYHVDFNMNIQNGVPGAEMIAGIINDTSDYVIRLKRLSDRSAFLHTGSRKLWVWIEYQTLVNLAGGSNQFSRISQAITKQLNPQ
ncbi:MAG: hypothetical protein KGQ60_00370 [Planctomycetes bacterium]|nr:hypothetical protein [Planctomycetota bacterium]